MQQEYQPRISKDCLFLNCVTPEMKVNVGNCLPFGTAQYIGRLGSSKFATFFLFQ
jgi:hypothetical protein